MRLLRQLPNLLTILRLCAVPLVLRAIWNREYEWALIWIFPAGCFDFLDGYLARKLHAESKVGAYLDPIADKLLLSGTYLMLGYDRVIPLWLTGIVFGRDLCIMLFSACAFFMIGHRDFPPSIWGKVSTTVQGLAALGFLLGGLMSWGPHEPQIRNGLYLVTAAATIWSAVHYSLVAVRIIRSGK